MGWWVTDASVVVLVLASILMAQFLAHRRGRPAMPWMMAAALLGPLPLIPLAMMHRRIFRH